MIELDVAIDGRPLVGRRTGIGVHTAEIASRLRTAPRPLIASHTKIDDASAIEDCRFVARGPGPGVLWQQTVLPRIAAGADVLWGPHGTLPLALDIPSVVTVHDLTSITMPFAHRLRTIASFNTLIAPSLTKADRIVCVSRDTADAIVRGFAVDRARVHVVHNGVDPYWAGDDATALPFDLTPGSYVFYLGTIEPRKGIDVLIDAWSALSAPRPRLVLSGAEGWRMRRVLSRIEASPLRSEIIISGYLPRAIVRQLLRHAAMFVYPSLYEGFGLPPLEAMAAGSPVIVSDGGALPEIAGPGAVVVRRGDPASLQSAMKRLLQDHAWRDALRARGREHARLFSWDDAAHAMEEILLAAAQREMTK